MMDHDGPSKPHTSDHSPQKSKMNITSIEISPNPLMYRSMLSSANETRPNNKMLAFKKIMGNMPITHKREPSMNDQQMTTGMSFS